MTQIKNLGIEKTTASNNDFLLLQSPEGETYHITKNNFLQGLIDTPTQSRTTWDSTKILDGVLTNNDLTFTSPMLKQDTAFTTKAIPAGKIYWEILTHNQFVVVGIAREEHSTNLYVGGSNLSWGYYGYNGNKYFNGSRSAFGSSFSNNSIIGVALDADSGSLFFYKDGTLQGNFSIPLGITFYPAISGDNNAEMPASATLRTLASEFIYPVPTGFTALDQG
ncbi:MAG: SPRY domain-containing protein [Crinalium sp.]